MWSFGRKPKEAECQERRHAGLRLSDLRELRQLREENRKLKTLVADLTLDKHILQEVLSKKAQSVLQLLFERASDAEQVFEAFISTSCRAARGRGRLCPVSRLSAVLILLGTKYTQ